MARRRTEDDSLEETEVRGEQSAPTLPRPVKRGRRTSAPPTTPGPIRVRAKRPSGATPTMTRARQIRVSSVPQGGKPVRTRIARVADPRAPRGVIELRGHRGTSGTRIALATVANGVELRVEVTGVRPQHGARRLDVGEAKRFLRDLVAALAIASGDPPAPPSSGAVAVKLALPTGVVNARVTRETPRRLAALADLLLQEVALAGVSLSPDLHPLAPADDDDDETQVR